MNGAVYVAKIKGYKNVTGLAKAHTILSWIGSLVVIGLVLVIGGVILLFLTGIGEVVVAKEASAVMTITFVILALVCISSGVAAIFASIYIKSTFNNEDSEKDAEYKSIAYRDAYLTAILLFVPSSLVIIFIIAYYVTLSAKKSKAKKTRAKTITKVAEAAKRKKMAEADLGADYDLNLLAPGDLSSSSSPSSPSLSSFPSSMSSVSMTDFPPSQVSTSMSLGTGNPLLNAQSAIPSLSM